MACCLERITSCCYFLLTVSSLFSSYKLFKDHRAPSIGFFLLGLSAGLRLLNPASCSSLQTEADWAAEVLAPVLVSFHLLWLSKDHNTALILLSGSCLLLLLSDRFSGDTLTLMTRCAGLSSLSCGLTVCLFAGNAAGAVGSVALVLPLLHSTRFTTDQLGSLVSTVASEGTMTWVLKVLLSLGCWTTTLALPKFLSELTDRSSLSF